MVLDSASAYAKVRGNVLTGVAGEDQLHDLALSRREARDAIHRVRSPGEQLGQRVLLLDKLVIPATQSRFPRQGLSQPVLLFCQLGFVTRNRVALRAFKSGALG